MRRRAAPVLHHRTRDGEDYHNADDRADDPSEVENVGVADAEPDGEDQVAERGPGEANEQRDAQDFGPLIPGMDRPA